jgi:hypothetical protein
MRHNDLPRGPILLLLLTSCGASLQSQPERQATLPTDWVKDFPEADKAALQAGQAYDKEGPYTSTTLKTYVTDHEWHLDRNDRGVIDQRYVNVKVFYRMVSGPNAGMCLFADGLVTETKDDSRWSTPVLTLGFAGDPAIRINCPSIDALPPSAH